MTVKVEHNTPNARKPMVLFDSVFSRGVVTVSSEAVGGEAANAFDQQTTDYWLPPVVPANVSVELPTAERVDCLAIAAHNIGTVGGYATVEYSLDGLTWVAVGSVTPDDDTTLMVLFQPVVAKWWRVSVDGTGVGIGIMRLGYRLVFPTGIMSGYTPTNLARRIDIQGGVTVGGQFTGQRVIRRGATTTIPIASMPRSFVDNDLAEFNSFYDDGNAFFYAGGPEVVPNDVAYCWRSASGGEMRPTYSEAGTLADISLNVEVFVNA